ncbi:MAG TPA: ABC transporter permease [Chloroflexota bacterium]|jgi:peptide/nickel transport system permease protein
MIVQHGDGQVGSLDGDALIPARSRRLRMLAPLWANPINILGALLVLGVLVEALIGRAVAPYSPTLPDYGSSFSAPSLQHFFGTDEVGRDVFSRVLAGSSTAMEVILVVVGIGASVGTLIGLISGYAGGWIDELLMRVTDIFLAFPVLVLAIAIAAILGPSLSHTMLALTVLWWPWYARLIRGQVLALREREYIEAAKASGVPPFRILWRHLLPNTTGPLLVQISLDLGYALLAASSLSFIGLGVQQPEPDWGLMINDAQPYLRSDWWVGFFPGLAIVLAVLGFNLLGDALGEGQGSRHAR